MKDMKVTTRIIADVEPEVKRKLQAIIRDTNQTMTGFIREAVEEEYKSKFGEEDN